MRLLAIDTALAACAAAIYDSESGAITSESLTMTRGHAEALLPLIARVVATAKLDYAALDRIVVTVGPGSFTGLRVGVAAARGIALAAGKPAVGITTLQAFAKPAADADIPASMLAVIDARHDHVYLQQFGSNGKPLDEARVVAANEVAGIAPHRVHLVGNAARLIGSLWPLERSAPTMTQSDAPEIEWVARLGADADLATTRPKPLYLRPPDARPRNPASMIPRA